MNGNTMASVYYPGKPIKPYAGEQKRLFATAMIFGIGMLLYVVCNNIISLYLTSDPAIYERYVNDGMFAIAMGMINTVGSIFLPFALVYLWMRKKNYVPEMPLGGTYDPINAVLLIFAGMASCYVANTVTSYLTVIGASFGIESYTMLNYEMGIDEVTPLSAIMQIIGYSVFPALFEEFAYRGVVMQSLRRYGDWFAIMISAFLFGLIHGNLMQFPFAFMVGIVLGYCTVVTGSMWVSIAIHFGNNFVSTLNTILMSAYGESVAIAFSMAVIYSFLLIGVICLIAYMCRNRAFFRLRPSRYRYMQHKTALVFLAPSVLFSCCFFLYTTLMDIVGFYEWFSDGIHSLLFYFIGG